MTTDAVSDWSLTKRLPVQLRDGCMRSDRHLCQALLQEVKKNFAVLKSRLEIFMQLETQRKQLSNSHH